MRLVKQGIQMYRSRPRRQDILSLRHTRLRITGLCLECRKGIPFIQLRHRPHATLCTSCVQERLDCLSADAL